MSSFTANVPVDPLKLIRVAYSVRETDRNPFNYCTSAGVVLEQLSGECSHITVPSGQPNNPFFIFPRAVLTNYRSKRGSGPHYPLDAICFLLERKDDSYTNYLQDVRRLGLTVVSLPDKRELVEYLMMASEETEYAAVDTSAELPVPLMLFPDSPEAVREQQHREAAAPAKKRERTEKEKSSKQPEKAIETNRKGTFDTSSIRPALSTEALFHCDKDFSGINSSFKTFLNGSLNSAVSGKNPPNSSSLLDQISSINTANKSSSSASSSSTVWIIIVPSGSSALVTLHNVKEFLTEGRYVSVNEARSRGPKPSSVRFTHHGHSFELIDNPARLSVSDWSRVLACFTLSSTWQFKDWKWDTPLELFQHIVGFHVYFDDVAVDPVVAGWNVTKLAISRNKRHLDSTAVMTFWERISDAIRTKAIKK